MTQPSKSFGKKELVDFIHGKLSVKHKVSKADIENVLDETIAFIKEGLAAGSKLTIRGLASLYYVNKQSRVGRNPKTGETITLPARSLLKFKPSGQTKIV